jgi:hypothetical protein
VVLLLLILFLLRKNNMETQNVFLGATGDIVSTYDNSGVVQPGSSSAPVDTSAIDPNTGVVITPDQQTETDTTTKSGAPWMLYLGGAIVFYYLLLKKK